MKHRLLLLFVFLVGLSSAVSAQKVSLNYQQAKLEDIFADIRQQTGINFVYSRQVIDPERQVSITTNQTELSEVLDQLFAQVDIKFEMTGNKVFLSPKQESANSKKLPSSAITGTIVDRDSGEPLIGATIQIMDSPLATVTDAEGHYSLSNVAEGKHTLIINYIGYNKKTQEIDVNVNQSLPVTIELAPSHVLSEVVITALGISREEKSLGYSVTKLENEDIAGTQTRNWTDALSGRVAGLTLLKSGGGPYGSNKLILRGENSLDGNNEALIVLDGVVINSSSGKMTGTGATGYNTSGETSVDFGSSLGDINPDDIESVSILKGAGAAALYGARGANGAIIITTKSGATKTNGMGLTFNSNVDLETISSWPDYQYSYGQGADGQDTWYSYGSSPDGISTSSTSSAWGPKFNGQSYFQYDPLLQGVGKERTPWVPYKNNHKDFFRTGVTYTNSVSIDGGNKKSNSRISYTNKTNQWIIPNTGYKRNTVAINSNFFPTEKLKLSVKANYTNKSSDNLPATGYGSQTIMYYMRGLVPNRNSDWDETRWLNGQTGIKQNRPFSSLIDNPNVIANEYLNASYRNQLTGNTAVSYDIVRDLNLTLRASIDWMSDNRSQQRPKDSQSFRDGMYRTQNIFSMETNYDFMLSYKKKIGSLESSLQLGGSQLENKYIKDELRADKLSYPGVYNFANSLAVPTSLPYRSSFMVNSLYGLLTTNYKFLYLDVAGRNDWTSTLASRLKGTSNCSFFYPSVNLSAIITEAFTVPEPLSYLKIRASWAKVGSGGTTPYRTDYSYETRTGFDAGLQNPAAIANEDLKALTTVSTEGGVDIVLFKNRWKTSFSLYRSRTYDQIVQATIDPSTGFQNAIMNAGEVRNEGYEIESNLKIIRSKTGFNWSVYGTLSHNDNKLIELTPELDVYTIGTGPGSRGAIEAHPGGSLSALWGLGYKRSPDGQIVYDNNGYAVLGTKTKYLGNTIPDWKCGWGTELSWKNISLNVLFDAQYGGVGYSLTHAVLAEEGKLTKTLPGRYNGIIGDGVQEVLDANGDVSGYVKNEVLATSARNYYYSHFNRDNVESNTFKTDFIKLREVRLAYRIPDKLIRKLSIRTLEVGVFGRDLYTWTHWPAFDPEFGQISGSDIVSGFETAQFPATRVMGCNLKVSF